ncbi:MAG: hypothetical protein EAZ85_00135 [Bacteroidetes bacterium]|nr:MAG: hypothetical protein EAZ85_00135 [Bacteroidota bacterium]TAG90561.1 MAG: hypothetical protein EAZ20_04040 [Bacteroidota bacterium]
MKLLPIFYTIFLLFVVKQLSAQEPLTHEKKSYVDSLGRYYQQATLPVYLFISHTPTGTPTPLSPLDNPKIKNEYKPIYLDGHGKHNLRHIDGLHKTEDNFVIYADGLAPTSNITFSGAPYIFNNGKNYYGKGLKVDLRTKDEMSGIQNLYQSINGTIPFTPYNSTIDFGKEGNYDLKFYAVDNVGNVEKVQNNIFTVDVTPPKTYHSIVGISSNNIISTGTKIYLSPSDSISGLARTYYELDGDGEKLYPAPRALIPFTYLNDGEHTLTYYSIDKVTNKEEATKVTFYLDKTSPIMSADILGDRFIVGEGENAKVYFSGRTKLKLTAVDNKSGIKKVLYSVDNEPYKDYDDPFYLPNKAGLHTIKYYAVDNMDNQGAGNDMKYDEYTHSVGQVYVDLTGPTLNSQFLGANFQKGDTTFISRDTKVAFTATDPESGLQRITYSIDGDAVENAYNQSFSVLQGGYHKVEYYGYDNVNNRNVKNIEFIVDDKGPEVFATFSSPPIDKETNTYPSFISIFLAATDMGAGYEEIRYSINEQPEQPYLGIIRNFQKNKNYRLVLRAIDKLGNVTKREFNFRTGKY